MTSTEPGPDPAKGGESAAPPQVTSQGPMTRQASQYQQRPSDSGNAQATITLQESFAKSLPVPRSSHRIYEGMMTAIGDVIGFFGSVPCCFMCPNPFRTIQQGHVGLIQKFGKCYRIVDPGLYQINLLTEAIRSVDIRMHVEDIPRQYVMTKDNVNVTIDSVLYWHVTDPYGASFLVENVRTALIERTQTTLRHIVGQRTLQDAIENRDTIAMEMQRIVDEPSRAWGVKVESILVKDLQFSAELLETLAAAAKQKRIGESKVIAAQAEVEAAKLMREASDILNTKAAMQIRYLETLQTMAKSSGAKIIFMPLEQDEKLNAMEAGAVGSSRAKGLPQKVINAQVLQEM